MTDSKFKQELRKNITATSKVFTDELKTALSDYIHDNSDEALMQATITIPYFDGITRRTITIHLNEDRDIQIDSLSHYDNQS